MHKFKKQEIVYFLTNVKNVGAICKKETQFPGLYLTRNAPFLSAAERNFMRYENVISGRFVDRPNRFIAHVDVNGVVETVHDFLELL